MLSTKIGTTIVTLIAAGSFATATIVPAVSQAKDSSSNSSDASKCQENREMGQHSIEEAVQAVGRGDYFGASIWSSYASDDAKEAEKHCGAAAVERSATKVRIGRGVRITLTASAGFVGVTPVPAPSQAARTSTLPTANVQRVATAVALEASSTEQYPSKADESECKKEAQNYNKDIGKAHDAAASGNIAKFTEYFQVAVEDLYGLKAVGCKVVAK
jgi:hypothetical protein